MPKRGRGRPPDDVDEKLLYALQMWQVVELQRLKRPSLTFTRATNAVAKEAMKRGGKITGRTIRTMCRLADAYLINHPQLRKALFDADSLALYGSLHPTDLTRAARALRRKRPLARNSR